MKTDVNSYGCFAEVEGGYASYGFPAIIRVNDPSGSKERVVAIDLTHKQARQLIKMLEIFVPERRNPNNDRRKINGNY